MGARTEIRRYLEEGASLRASVGTDQAETIEEMAVRVIECLQRGGKLLLCGNGGSAADAQHIAAEFVNKLERKGRPLAGLALTTDSSVLTSIANDEAFAEVFSRQVMALGRPGDCLLAISTSGSSANVLRAAEVARRIGITVLSLTGARGEELVRRSDVSLRVPSENTQQIQEVHIAVGHILSALAENALR